MMFNKKVKEGFTHTITPDPIAKPSIPRTIPSHRGAATQPARAVINAGLHIKGDLETDGEVQIDGQVTGKVSCAHLMVGTDGAIIGDVDAKEVVIRGKVNGTIRTARLALLETAHVVGDIFYATMSMEEGANFVGASNKDEASALVTTLNQTVVEMQ